MILTRQSQACIDHRSIKLREPQSRGVVVLVISDLYRHTRGRSSVVLLCYIKHKLVTQATYTTPKTIDYKIKKKALSHSFSLSLSIFRSLSFSFFLSLTFTISYPPLTKIYINFARISQSLLLYTAHIWTDLLE